MTPPRSRRRHATGDRIEQALRARNRGLGDLLGRRGARHHLEQLGKATLEFDDQLAHVSEQLRRGTPGLPGRAGALLDLREFVKGGAQAVVEVVFGRVIQHAESLPIGPLAPEGARRTRRSNSSRSTGLSR